MKTKAWFGALAVAIVAAGAWSLSRRASNQPGPLEPLAWLVGGVWRAEAGDPPPSRSFAWSGRGLVLRETREDSGGEPAGEVTYHWHHAKDEIAVYGVLPTAHFEGVLRPGIDAALELQWKLYGADGSDSVELFRERLRPEGDDRMVWSLYRWEEKEERLVTEAVLVRRRR